MKKLKDMGVDDNTIVVFTTDNGTEVFTWPDGGTTPFAQSKGTVMEGGFRVPASCAGPVMYRQTRCRTASSPVWTGSQPSSAAAGNPDITEELLKGMKLGDRTYKNHLDGYNQMDVHHRQRALRASRDLLSRRKHGRRGAHRRLQVPLHRPTRWLARRKDAPRCALHHEPAPGSIRATGWPNNGTKEGGQQYFDWFKFQFWRFVFVQQVMGKALQTFLEFPPMQRGASFNLDAIKAEMGKRSLRQKLQAKVLGNSGLNFVIPGRAWQRHVEVRGSSARLFSQYRAFGTFHAGSHSLAGSSVRG